MMPGPMQAVVFCPTPLGIFEQSLALQERGWLGRMAIGFYADFSRSPIKHLPNGRVRRYLARRSHPGLDPRLVACNPWYSAVVEGVGRLSRDIHHRDRAVFWSNDRFDRWVAGQLPRFGNMAFGYESGSLCTFRRAERLGMPKVLYQPIACAEDALHILAEEALRRPELAGTLRYNWFPAGEIERRQEERDLADSIICASTFTRDSLVRQGVDSAKILVEPYGVDHDAFRPSEEKYSQFSVIWAGSFTQTKGIGYLFDALATDSPPDTQLVLAGYPSGADMLRRYDGRVRVRQLGRLDRPALGHVMRRCHAHVFPTLLDGFGRNIVEAMASGLPVVTTSHCAGPDLIEDGVTGFIVPIRDPVSISEKLRWIHDNPAQAQEMGQRAADRVACLTKADYRTRFAGRLAEAWDKTSATR